MAFALHEGNSCESSTEEFTERIRGFSARTPENAANPIRHSQSDGLICFDFTKAAVQNLLSAGGGGLRIIPALDRNGNLTVVITPYNLDGNEVFDSNDKLIADCCPQPPPPFNKSSRLYHELFP